ncbi:hypothetical protein QEH52_02440 [Coraliomargarita sp. SDUM461003]|uniref:Tetratricopeptide repeat protein n=1 Tax=Thalassobacterium maritimum TaxID=3041265 RepID=A0ABU1AQC8_9BACT|nr:hypothetical protein [Coraliomargarita sp. SDUM461003]MDQ8206350.1 hypothetical protein [Coraliomargarita sp. SDUM461003]
MSQQDALNTGIEYLRVFNFSDAYQVLSDVQSSYSPEGNAADWQVATYSLAIAAWHQSPPSQEGLLEARSLMESIIEHAPGSLYAASAMLDIGRILEIAYFHGDSVDVLAAQRYYQRVREEFAGTDMALRATLYLAQSRAQSFDSVEVQTAIDLLESEMSELEDSPWLGILAQYTAQLYAFYLDQPKQALQPYAIAMEAGFPRSADSDASLWQFALLAEKAEDYEFAARIFARLLQDFPRSIYATISRERLVQVLADHPELTIEVPALPQSVFNLQSM